MLNKNILLEGNKVKLTPILEKDITKKYIGWLNDPIVVRYSNQRFIKHSLESCIEYLNSFDGTNNYFLAIRKKESGQVIGSVTSYLNIHHKTADIGLMVGDRSAWGQGIGQQTWMLLVEHLFSVEKVRKITGGTLSVNKAMKKIMENSGMELEAIKKQEEIVEGVAVDMHYYSIFRDAKEIDDQHSGSG